MYRTSDVVLDCDGFIRLRFQFMNQHYTNESNLSCYREKTGIKKH